MVDEVIEWLKTPAGEHWSMSRFKSTCFRGGSFAEIKLDHECRPERCSASRWGGNNFSYTDRLIKKDIAKYGMNGIRPRDDDDDDLDDDRRRLWHTD